jgi:hypothetical protein
LDSGAFGVLAGARFFGVADLGLFSAGISDVQASMTAFNSGSQNL